MATRYFKRASEREVCTTSSGNRSSVQPGAPGYPYAPGYPCAPGYPYDWVEIEQKEFTKLRRKIESGRTPRAVDKSGAGSGSQDLPSN